jgi:hypothetical protein
MVRTYLQFGHLLNPHTICSGPHHLSCFVFLARIIQKRKGGSQLLNNLFSTTELKVELTLMAGNLYSRPKVEILDLMPCTPNPRS